MTTADVVTPPRCTGLPGRAPPLLRPAVPEQTLRDVLGGAGWGITSLEPAALRGELDGEQVEMAFWYLRAGTYARNGAA